MKYKFPLLVSVGSLALVLSSCTAVSTTASSYPATSAPASSAPASESAASTSPAASTEVSSPNSSSPVAQPSVDSEEKKVTAEQIIPTLSRPDSSDDALPAELEDASIKLVSIRTLAPLSYAEEFAAVNDKGELCLVAWANSGDGDGSATLNGPAVECANPATVKTDGLSVRIKATKDNPGVVLNVLPPDLTKKVVRQELLKIPGNHEDLRPPVEFGATDFGLVSVAMLPETADELGKISIPRPDGSKFSLNLG